MKINVLKISMLFLFLHLSQGIHSHASNQSYTFLRMHETVIKGRFEIAIKDINRAIGTEIKDGQPIEQVNPILPKLKDYLTNRIRFSSAIGMHPILFENVSLQVLKKLGDYVLLEFT